MDGFDGEVKGMSEEGERENEIIFITVKGGERCGDDEMKGYYDLSSELLVGTVIVLLVPVGVV